MGCGRQGAGACLSPGPTATPRPTPQRPNGQWQGMRDSPRGIQAGIPTTAWMPPSICSVAAVCVAAHDAERTMMRPGANGHTLLVQAAVGAHQRGIMEVRRAFRNHHLRRENGSVRHNIARTPRICPLSKAIRGASAPLSPALCATKCRCYVEQRGKHPDFASYETPSRYGLWTHVHRT